VMKIAFFRLSADELNDIIDKVGKTVIDIGDGLTLLHQAAQFDRPDLLEILLEKGHDIEVSGHKLNRLTTFCHNKNGVAGSYKKRRNLP